MRGCIRPSFSLTITDHPSMTDPANYQTYRGIPPLAGLCRMERAVKADWSLEESVSRLKRLHYLLRRLHETFTSRITAEPIYELKTAYSYHAYLCAEQVSLIRRRVAGHAIVATLHAGADVERRFVGGFGILIVHAP